ncbi:MAG: multi-sensor hybrid histidine kinase, partial [Caulobacter sp.]|nr:multi-sensor hybrid histidine kinase [Caulobacter sp.]
QAQLALNEESIRLATSAAGVGIWDLDLTTDHLTWCDRTKAMFGISPGTPCSMADFYAGLHPDDFDATSEAFASALDPFRRATYDVEYRTIGKEDGVIRWVAAKGKGLFEGERCIRAIGTAIDITARKAAEQALHQTENELRAETHALQILNRAGALVAANLDLSEVVQTVTDAGVELTGASFGAFFYNVLNEAGESYTLYTLSGVPREAFAKFPMPRNTAIFEPPFNGEGPMRSEDILMDPRYGHNAPHKGMPEGHLPVKSYLAVPVRSRSGEVLGGLFFGHPEPGIFNARAEELMTGLAGQASVAIDNARLFQASQREIAQRKSAEEMLQQLNATLEDRVAEEIVQRGKAEEALRQAQKMEAVGQLTGGVAHDFNNLLMVIQGGLDMLDRQDDPARRTRLLQGMRQAAERGSALTRQLLAFSRRQPLAPEAVDLQARIGGMRELLDRSLRGDVHVDLEFDADVWPVEVDAGELELVILNLAFNARDAMPKGGEIVISAGNVVDWREGDVVGDFVRLEVRDSGTGMSEKVKARVFEPFFTTKEIGKGSGLGLAQAYGFARQSGGSVRIESTEGEGTRVILMLPRSTKPVVEAARPALDTGPVRTASRFSGCVLLVEDDDEVAALVTEMLHQIGFDVTRAASAVGGLGALANGRKIDVVFSDIMMPGDMNGVDLAREIHERRPDLPVLLTSGFAEASRRAAEDLGVHVLPKPYRLDDLASAIRETMGNA